MATIERSAYATIGTALSTQLDGLTSGSSSAASAAIDNSATHALYHDLELAVTFGVAPADNAVVEVYLLPSVDDTNYADGSNTVLPRGNLLAGVFFVRNVTTAQRLALRNVEVPPGSFKYLIRNTAGQSMAASGNTLKYRPHELLSV